MTKSWDIWPEGEDALGLGIGILSLSGHDSYHQVQALSSELELLKNSERSRPAFHFKVFLFIGSFCIKTRETERACGSYL